MKKILLVLGTRPEGIKMAPLYHELKSRSSEFDVKLCSTGQHKEMLDQVFDFFEITPDYNLSVMRDSQTLAGVTQRILEGIDGVLEEYNPDVVLVQGDTTTVLAGALAAFYRNIKIGHVEAGLRTWDIKTPFPEEANRVLVSRIADYHFTPTEQSTENLKKEGISKSVYLVGNTVTDAIVMASKLTDDLDLKTTKFKDVDFNKKIILLTSHRRENLGQGLKSICEAVERLAHDNDVEFVFPVHLNPKVREVVYGMLGHLNNVHLYGPFDYPELVWLMKSCYMVMTDSGGIQEEAPSLGKPVLVLRESTERPEGVEAGTAKLVGTDADLIISNAEELIKNEEKYKEMAHAVNPYGDGHCSERICDILE